MSESSGGPPGVTKLLTEAAWSLTVPPLPSFCRPFLDSENFTYHHSLSLRIPETAVSLSHTAVSTSQRRGPSAPPKAASATLCNQVRYILYTHRRPGGVYALALTNFRLSEVVPTGSESPKDRIRYYASDPRAMQTVRWTQELSLGVVVPV